MLIINFSHPLTNSQILKIESITGQKITEIKEIACQFDPQSPFQKQVETLIESVGLTASQWQSSPLLINPPSLATIALVLLADLHGLIGHLPSIIRLKPQPDSTPTIFEVAEIINLQVIRDSGRASR